jgi:hypothetical protein
MARILTISTGFPPASDPARGTHDPASTSVPSEGGPSVVPRAPSFLIRLLSILILLATLAAIVAILLIALPIALIVLAIGAGLGLLGLAFRVLRWKLSRRSAGTGGVMGVTGNALGGNALGDAEGRKNVRVRTRRND